MTKYRGKLREILIFDDSDQNHFSVIRNSDQIRETLYKISSHRTRDNPEDVARKLREGTHYVVVGGNRTPYRLQLSQYAPDHVEFLTQEYQRDQEFPERPLGEKENLIYDITVKGEKTKRIDLNNPRLERLVIKANPQPQGGTNFGPDYLLIVAERRRRYLDEPDKHFRIFIVEGKGESDDVYESPGYNNKVGPRARLHARELSRERDYSDREIVQETNVPGELSRLSGDTHLRDLQQREIEERGMSGGYRVGHGDFSLGEDLKGILEKGDALHIVDSDGRKLTTN